MLKTNPGCIRAGARPLLWHPVAKFTMTAVCLSVRELCCTKQASLAFYAAVYYKEKEHSALSHAKASLQLDQAC